MRVLIVSDHYSPAYKAGGPVRSLVAIVQSLADDVEFFVLTGSTDLGDSTPLPGVEIDRWNKSQGATVWYSSVPLWSTRLLRRTLREVRPDLLYLNSFFSTSVIATLLWRRLGILDRVPVLLAPRGQFSQGALQLKARKKKAFLWVVRRLRLYAGVTWHASSSYEQQDIRRAMPESGHTGIAPNLITTARPHPRTCVKTQGEVRFVYIGRINPKKNITFALELLKGASGQVVFDIYGPLEDSDYWRRCEDIAARLPTNVQVSHKGVLPPSMVPRTLDAYHFLLMPTLGENFGHSIAESLQQGVPVVISDQTPWRMLEDSGVGWDVQLGDASEWQRVLHACSEMEDEYYQEMCRKCSGFAESWIMRQGGSSATLRLFREARRIG